VRLRILTWNIHKCIGGVDRRYRPERTAEVLRHYAPDLALLQEVDEGARRSRQDRQAELLAAALGYGHLAFFPNVTVRSGGAYGNAVLSRHPIAAARNICLTYPGFKRRSVLHAVVHAASPGGRAHPVHVYNLHLGLSGFERRWQLERFLASHPFATLPLQAPVVVGGDFNDVWGRLGVTYLEPAGFRGQQRPARTFPAIAPVRALDAIYVRGHARIRQIHRSQLQLSRFASDHLPLIADLTLA